MITSEKQIEILRFENGASTNLSDTIAVEEPLEIRIVFGRASQRKTRSLSVTMRTPGNDFELAAGFLISEGIVSEPNSIFEHRFCGPPTGDDARSNTIELELDGQLEFEYSKLHRHFYTTSSCGVCGKASLDAIKADNITPLKNDLTISPTVIHGLPNSLRKQQAVFNRTGGLHAAGLATAKGEIVAVREDVGRHNAVDKLIGSRYLSGRFPVNDYALVLSGRASFELLQKSLLAAIPLVIAVGAPSSLAIELAREFNVTLVGFTSSTRFNVYAGDERIV